MLTIIFETLTIILFIVFYGKIQTDFGRLFFWEIVMLSQLPALSFLQHDFLARRPTLVEKLLKIFIRILIATLIVGFFGVILLLDWKSGIVGILVILVVGLMKNWKNIESFFDKRIKQPNKNK